MEGVEIVVVQVVRDKIDKINNRVITMYKIGWIIIIVIIIIMQILKC